jgi:hypothetical protein
MNRGDPHSLNNMAPPSVHKIEERKDREIKMDTEEEGKDDI